MCRQVFLVDVLVGDTAVSGGKDWESVDGGVCTLVLGRVQGPC